MIFPAFTKKSENFQKQGFFQGAVMHICDQVILVTNTSGLESEIRETFDAEFGASVLLYLL